MLQARYGARYEEALILARESAAWLHRFTPGKQDRAEASTILNIYLKVADQCVRRHQLDEALELTRLAGDFARLADRKDYIPDFLWVSTDVYRQRGELDRSLSEINQSVEGLEPRPGTAERWRNMNPR